MRIAFSLLLLVAGGVLGAWMWFRADAAFDVEMIGYVGRTLAFILGWVVAVALGLVGLGLVARG